MSEAEDVQEPVPRAPRPVEAAAPAGSEQGSTRPANRFWVRRSHIGIGIALFLAINLLLLAGYLWSRGGQTVHVRVEARGNEFAAYVDGRLRVRAQFDAPETGGLVLTLEDTSNLPSLPRPSGIDHVRLTDLASGEVLLEDNFSSGYGPWWTKTSGTFKSEDGVLDTEGPGELAITDWAWRDYAVDVEYRNITSGAIMLRAQDSTTGVIYRFWPFWMPDNEFALMDQGHAVDVSPGTKIELRRGETIKSLVAMALNPYPLTLLLLTLGVVAVGALQFVRIPRLLFRASGIPLSLPWFAAGALVSGALGMTLFISHSYVLRMPHVPDATSYIFQAKLLASGQLSAPPPPVREAFHVFFIGLSDGKWASIYPFGHPLVLALGVKLGAIWLVPPLVGAACVALIFLVGRTIHSNRVGLLAALLLAASPFFLMTASNFMPHNTAAFYVLGSLLFLTMIERRPLLYGVLAGLFFGLLFNTRPLTAVALIPPFGLLLLGFLLPQDRRRIGVQQIGGFIAGGLIMLGAYWLYNYGTTGDAFINGYQASSDLNQAVGFGGRHTVNVGIQNEKSQMAFLLLVLNGWPQYVGLTFVLLPFILATRSRWDWFLLACAVFAMGAWTVYENVGTMHGPRYWYESIPFLMLLAARGADRAAGLLADAAGSVRRTLFGIDRRPLWAGVVVVYALVFALVGSSLYGWLLGKNDGWQVMFVPERAASLQGFMEVDDRLIKLVNEADVHNALVLVEDCGVGRDWYCYGSVFWLNSPTLDGDVVFARDVEGRRAELLQAFPDRAVYLATYRPPSLVPYDRAP